jgi:hypothetical protein
MFLIEYCPLISELEPEDDSFIKTDAPITGSPLLSIIFPLKEY